MPAGQGFDGVQRSFAVTTDVDFAALSSSEIAAYIATGPALLSFTCLLLDAFCCDWQMRSIIMSEVLLRFLNRHFTSRHVCSEGC